MSGKFSLVLIWSVIIIILSLMPNPEIKAISWSDGFQVDKIAHIVLYAIYSFLIGRYLLSNSGNERRKILLTLGISVTFGVLMEILQYYLSPSRFFDILDIIANIIGSIVGLLILKIKN